MSQKYFCDNCGKEIPDAGNVAKNPTAKKNMVGKKYFYVRVYLGTNAFGNGEICLTCGIMLATEYLKGTGIQCSGPEAPSY